MGLHIEDNMIVIRKLKTFYFDLPKVADNNLKHETEFMISCNESLAQHKVKNEIIVQMQAWARYS